MSHSKLRKKGNSLYLDSWNPSAKRFIVACVQCGTKGFKPCILESDFDNTLERKVIRRELTATLKPLEIDDSGICKHCMVLLKKEK